MSNKKQATMQVTVAHAETIRNHCQKMWAFFVKNYETLATEDRHTIEFSIVDSQILPTFEIGEKSWFIVTAMETSGATLLAQQKRSGLNIVDGQHNPVDMSAIVENGVYLVTAATERRLTKNLCILEKLLRIED